MTYMIDRGVPIPEMVRGHRCAYPFAQMQAGDSFVAPAKELKKVRPAIRNWQKTHPDWEFTTRKLQSGGVRVWVTQRPGLPSIGYELPRVPITRAEEAPPRENVGGKLRELSKLTPTGSRTVKHA